VAVTPDADAPPFEASCRHSRTHGGAYLDAYRNRPVSGSHDGFASAASLPTPLETRTPCFDVGAARAALGGKTNAASAPQSKAVIAVRHARRLNTLRSVARPVAPRRAASQRSQVATITPRASVLNVRLNPTSAGGAPSSTPSVVTPSACTANT
jgi:hypothetical protein